MSALRLLAYVPFIAGGVVAVWSLSRDLWRLINSDLMGDDQ